MEFMVIQLDDTTPSHKAEGGHEFLGKGDRWPKHEYSLASLGVTEAWQRTLSGFLLFYSRSSCELN